MSKKFVKDVMYEIFPEYKKYYIVSCKEFLIKDYPDIILNDVCCLCCAGSYGMEIILKKNENEHIIYRLAFMKDEIIEYDYNKCKDVIKGYDYVHGHRELKQTKPSIFKKLYYQNYDYKLLVDADK